MKRFFQVQSPARLISLGFAVVIFLGSALLTLPCSAPIRWSALYSLLSEIIKPEYAKPVKKCAGLFS